MIPQNLQARNTQVTKSIIERRGECSKINNINRRSKKWQVTVPEADFLQVERILDDARRGYTDAQDILLCG